MATAAGVLKRDPIKDAIFVWEGRDRAGKVIKGEMRAGGKNVVHATLRRQGINVTKVRKQRLGGGKIAGIGGQRVEGSAALGGKHGNKRLRCRRHYPRATASAAIIRASAPSPTRVRAAVMW